MAERYEDLVVEVVVNVSKSDEEPVRNLFGHGMPYELIDGIATSDGQIKLRKAIDKADLIISYPTPHFLVPPVIELFKDSMKPVISLTEYNFDMEFQLLQKKRISIVPGTFFLSSGVSEGNLGIYIEKFSKPAKIHPTDYGKLPSDLMSENKELYFGYFNKLFDSRTGATPSRFIAFAINNSDKKEVDIVLPLQPQGTPNVSSESNVNVLFSTGFIRELEDFNHVLISYFPPEPSPPVYLAYAREGNDLVVKEVSREEFESQKSVADKLIRIINPFPLHKESMRALVEASEPVNLITGDQSLSEALSLLKIVFYQAMPWKKKFYEALITTSQKYAKLQEWFKMVDSKTRPIKSLVEFYKKNKDILHAEAQALLKDFEANKNLSVLFPNYLDNFLQSSPYERFTQFIDHLNRHPEYYSNVKNRTGKGYTLNKGDLINHLIFYLKTATSAEEKNKMLNYFDSNTDFLIKLEDAEKVWFYSDVKSQYPDLRISLPAYNIIKCLETLNPLEEDIFEVNTFSPILKEGKQLQELMISLSNIDFLEFADISKFTPEDKLSILQKLMRYNAFSYSDKKGQEGEEFWLQFLENETDEHVWRETLKLLFTTPCYRSIEDGASFDIYKPNLFSRIKNRSELVNIILNHPTASVILAEELFLTDQPTIAACNVKMNELVLNSFFSMEGTTDTSRSFFRHSPVMQTSSKEKELIGKMLSAEGALQSVIQHFLEEKLANDPREMRRFKENFAEYLPQHLKNFISEENISPSSQV
ncbi:hypothetical protein [Legionella lansingensis]|uniref:hypothetical protein n=1 Tax=Legionella lansingensis TaxID=45067 RepID=UPI0012E3A1E9|nr:hypothetical protein [Legionella lansingensis]